MPDVPVDRAGFFGPSLTTSTGAFDEFGSVVADAEVGFADAADDPVRGQAVDIAAQVRMKSVPPPEKIQQEKPAGPQA